MRSTSPAVDVAALRIPTTLALGGKTSVVDDTSVRINLRWEAADGRLVTGRAKLYRQNRGAETWSLAATSQVVGRPGVRSPHSYGGSIDINPWENPYVSQQGTYPNTWWLSRSHPKVSWRSWTHPVVQAFKSRGFAWGGAYRDYHHFQR